MITEHTGSLFESTAYVIGHGVNCYGLMGAGIAKEFKRLFPDMFEQYELICQSGLLKPGDVFPWQARKHLILNIASQNAPGANAKMYWLYDAVQQGMEIAAVRGRDRIALPRIGCGIGGLRWDSVKSELDYLDGYKGVSIEVWSL